jgi:hypothetical protein
MRKMLGGFVYRITLATLSLADWLQGRNRSVVGTQKLEMSGGLLNGMVDYIARSGYFNDGTVADKARKHIRRNVISAAAELGRAIREGAA